MPRPTDSDGRPLCECGCGRPVDVAPRTRRAIGWVQGEPKRFIHGHNRRSPTPSVVLVERTERRGPDECWPWLGAVDDMGYGYVGDRGIKLRAHRIAYEVAFGKIPEGTVVHHRCENKLCANPAHLETVTRAEHVRLHKPRLGTGAKPFDYKRDCPEDVARRFPALAGGGRGKEVEIS